MWIMSQIKTLRGGRLTTLRERYWIACLLSMLPLPLAWLFRIFGSDKSQTGQHAYGGVYAELFRPYRYARLKILEIGVLSGASMLGWRAYFPSGTIIGCDIEDKSAFAMGRIRLHIVDQSSSADLARLRAAEGAFEIIVDDGSHVNAHQIFTFFEMFGSLKSGGLYIIEDVQTSYWPVGFGGAEVQDPAFAATCMGTFLELARYINHAEFFRQDNMNAAYLRIAQDITEIQFRHNLIIIRKGDNRQPSNCKDYVIEKFDWHPA